MILGLDTATAATAVAVWAPGGPDVEVRDDPEPGARPAHASRLLALVEEALGRAGATWDDIDRIAVGVGPGGFTGLRHGIATARALAQARELPVAGLSSLEVRARGAAEQAAAYAAERAVLVARCRAAARAGGDPARGPRRPDRSRAARSAACGRRRGSTLQGAARAGRGHRSGGSLSRPSRQRAAGLPHRRGGGARRQGRTRARLSPRARRRPAKAAPLTRRSR